MWGICKLSSLFSPLCICLRGFEPRNVQEWNRHNWTGGCVRRTPLQCDRVNNQTSRRKEDAFLKQKMVKVPAFAEALAVTPDICRRLCLANCSCLAYSHDSVIGCMSWTGKLLDIQQLQSGGLDLYVRIAYAELGMLYVLYVKPFET